MTSLPLTFSPSSFLSKLLLSKGHCFFFISFRNRPSIWMRTTFVLRFSQCYRAGLFVSRGSNKPPKSKMWRSIQSTDIFFGVLIAVSVCFYHCLVHRTSSGFIHTSSLPHLLGRYVVQVNCHHREIQPLSMVALIARWCRTTIPFPLSLYATLKETSDIPSFEHLPPLFRTKSCAIVHQRLTYCPSFQEWQHSTLLPFRPVSSYCYSLWPTIDHWEVQPSTIVRNVHRYLLPVFIRSNLSCFVHTRCRFDGLTRP